MVSSTLRRGNPRLYHKKSRTGCKRCKERRVKCDEKRPICTGCDRHGVSCVYESAFVTPVNVKAPKKVGEDAAERGLALLPPDDASVLEMPESKSRRLLELRLFNNYLKHLTQSDPAAQSLKIHEILSVDVPKMAFENDNLLYSLLSLSASHLIRTQEHNQELIAAREQYRCLAMREQRKAVDNICAENSDPVCFASLFISESAFAILYERSHDPYYPPMEWLHMGRGAGTLFSMALAKADSESKITSIVNAPPKIDRDAIITSEELRDPFIHLLKAEVSGAHSERWDSTTCEIYEQTLSCVGAIKRAIDDNEPPNVVGRWLLAFSLLVPDPFIDFVELMRPRALIILAYYFALAAHIGSVWWLGDTLRKEIIGIQSRLPSECQIYLHEPLSRVGLPP